MATTVNALLDRVMSLVVPRVGVVAGCPTERYYEECYCNWTSNLVYYRWCTVQSTCDVKCEPCFASQIRCL
ncbi:MAG: hypothetical protein V7603_4349 [Micromonosporaceae bacterium]|jgi:hypothetical protein